MEGKDNKNTNEIVLAGGDNYNTSLNANIEAFKKIQELVKFLITSDTFTKGFEQKDKGNCVITDPTTGKALINEADVAIAIMVGNSLGLDLASSLVVGSKLNQATYLSILKGRELGFGMATSMEKIYNISTSRGMVSYTGVDIISALLIQGKVDFLPLIKSNAPFYQYYDAVTNDPLDLDQILDEYDNLKPEYFLVHAKVNPDILRQKVADGEPCVRKTFAGTYSKVIMKRTYPSGKVQTISKRFSTVDAQQAGLLQIVNEKGAIIQNGKDNWNKATAQMLDNRVISIAGRIIGADLLQGIYSVDEIKDMGIIEDAKVVESKLDS